MSKTHYLKTMISLPVISVAFAPMCLATITVRMPTGPGKIKGKPKLVKLGKKTEDLLSYLIIGKMIVCSKNYQFKSKDKRQTK